MEMGRRDVRRGGTNRFSKKQSGSGFSTKSKKGMLKKLGLSDEKLNSSKKQEIDYEFSSDVEKEVSRKKTRIPKKNVKDTNGVDHASVPRKLRSAMKKRNLESISKLSSASSKRLNRSKTGIESFNKENQQMEAKAIVSKSMMMISEDEKEVAETLYGLAGMFTESEKTCDPLSDEIEISRVDDSSLVVEAESLEPAVSALSSDKTKLIDEIPPLEQSKGVVDFIDRLKQNSSVNTTDSLVKVIETKVATCETDYKTKGLALWPGLQSGAHLLSKPCSTKLPPWMGQAVYPSKNISEPLRIQPRKLKKCASHIYISRLIKQLQSSSHQNEQRCSEMSERVLPDRVTTITNFKTMLSPSKRYQNPYMLDLHTTHNPKPVQEDMTQLALDLYHPHTSQKQNYDFLSLSSSAGATQSHFPLLNSLPQYHHISAAYNSSQLSPSTSSHQIQQVSPYLASRFQTAYNANQQQQQQLQKRLWAAQYRPPTSGYMNQYIKPNLSLNLTSTSQPLHVASSPRYNNNNNGFHSQQQQQHHRLMAAAISMSHHQHQHNNNLNRQEHHLLPLIYDDTRTPLQLLCNEQS